MKPVTANLYYIPLHTPHSNRLVTTWDNICNKINDSCVCGLLRQTEHCATYYIAVEHNAEVYDMIEKETNRIANAV